MARAGRQHDQPIETEGGAGGGRHVRERGQEILVDGIALAVAALLLGHLRLQAEALQGGIGQLAEGVGQLGAAGVQLEPLGHARVAERFELYCCGVELANGFGELTDPELQRRRLGAEMDKKEERYGERYPIDEDFIAALANMPPASGCALGFDRLVMLATGATRIEQVLWTPLPRGD